MKVWGTTIEAVTTDVQRVSKERYGGNLRFKREPEKDGRSVSFTLTVKDSRAKGARRSNTGRRIAAACWHCNRDVMLTIFTGNPDARVKTAIADYKGFGDFVDKYPATGRTNVGSQADPMDFEDACNCEEYNG